MKKLINSLISSFIIVGVLLMFLNSCKKDNNSTQMPTLATASVTNITQTTASCGGTITDDGGGEITARGVCYSTSSNPTVADSKTSNGTGTGSFTSSITGLSPNTTYYLRAYATNSAGTAYGNELTFTTSENISLPTVSTNNTTDITYNSAICGGNITNNGGADITARGVCWNTTQNPTTSDNKTSDGTEPGSFTSSITGLSPNTTYYVRAYATNSMGTAYGSQINFTTSTVNLNLDGVWDRNDIEITISGSSGIFSEINSGWWLKAMNQGFISIGSLKFKNITPINTLQWSCNNLWLHYTGNNVDTIFWSSSSTLTMGNYGDTLTLWSESTYNGVYESDTYVLTRKAIKKNGLEKRNYHTKLNNGMYD
jgi:hypothetical protein